MLHLASFPRRALLAAPAALAALSPGAPQRTVALPPMGDSRPAPSAAPSSPFAAPASTGLLFVTDQAPLLDTACLFAFEGPITFDLLVDRYVGPVQPDGTLVDPAGLVAAGTLGPTATLVLPTFDVDADAVVPPPFAPEKDRVLFNGVEIGFLDGANNQWKLDSLQVPIALVRFADRAPMGQSPTPAVNTVTIEIDSANDPALELWCTSLDWGALAVQAASPVVLLHGEGSDPGFWDRHGFRPELESLGLAVDAPALAAQELEPASLALRQVLSDVARRHGADRLHLVAHDAGALEARAWVADFGHESSPAPASLTSITAPHAGTPAAGALWSRARLAEARAASDFGGFPGFAATLAPLLAASAGVREETGPATAAFSARTAGSLEGLSLHVLAADADADQSGAIDQPAEMAGLLLEDANLASAPPALALRSVDSAHTLVALSPAPLVSLALQSGPAGLGAVVVPSLAAAPASAPAANDAQVSVPSALGGAALAARVTQSATLAAGAARDHASAADDASARLVAPWLLAADRAHGDLP